MAEVTTRRVDKGRGRDKTDKSKTQDWVFWRKQKIQPNRPHLKTEVVWRKIDFNFFPQLMSIKSFITG